MSFENLPTAIDVGVAENPILPGEVRTADEAWDDTTALGIVLQDAESAIAYLQSKALVPVGVEGADNVYRAYSNPRQWPNGKPKASLSMPVALVAIEKILPALYMSLFAQGKKQPFLVTPIGKTKPEAARAQASLLSWAMKQAKLKEEMRLCLKGALQYGLTVGCWGWESKTQRKKTYTRKDGKMVGEWKDEDIEIPSFEWCNPREILVDPTLARQDVQSGAKFIIKQRFTDGYGLADFRDNPAYKNVPTDDELANFLANGSEPTEDTLAAQKQLVWREFQAQLNSEKSSKDPMAQPLEILEYTTKDRVVTVLQRKLVIRNDANEFGRLNYQSCAYIDVLGSAWGFGICKLLAGEQRLQTGVVNSWIDSLALTLNPVYLETKGIGPGTQSVPTAPGKVITTSGEMKPLITPDVTRPAMEALTASNERANEKAGSNSGAGMAPSVSRTAEGVQAFTSDVVQRLQYFLEQFINLVYIPTLEAFLMIMKDHLTIDQVNSILTAEEGKAYEGDIADVYNAEVDVDVVAGANMMARFAASQLAPMVIQLVSAGPVADQLEVAGKKFAYDEFLTETLDMMGWDVNNLVVDMTPADLQRLQQKNAAVTKVQGDLALQGQKHQDNLSEIDAKASGQAGVAVVRQLLKTHADQAMQALDNLQNTDSQVAA